MLARVGDHLRLLRAYRPASSPPLSWDSGICKERDRVNGYGRTVVSEIKRDG